MSLFKKNFILKTDYIKYRNINYTPLMPVVRQKNLSEVDRRAYATELLDTYYGFGLHYLKQDISESFSVASVRERMYELAYALPLLEKFIRTISRVYTIIPTRKFYQNGKEILAEKPNIIDSKKYIVNETLYNTLNDLYNDGVNISIKEIEKLTNLMNTLPVKVVTDINGKIKLINIPNDSIQICENKEDITVAKDIIFIIDEFDVNGNISIEAVEEVWNAEFNILQDPITKKEVEGVNKAGKEATKLYGNNQIGWAFAPFVIFRNAQPTMSFWDVRGKDLVDYISSINMALTELRYLTRYTAFDLKYTINLKTPKDGISDPMGVIQFAIDSSAVPGGDGDKNWDIGEFKNHGSIKEVIESIIFNLKMIYDIFDINLDSLITTNSVRSADSKDKDKENLFDWVNSQREIWNLNEQNLFKVMSAVHNRDNKNKIPKGIELQVNFEELDTSEKTNEDWMTEIQNGISSFIDWLSDMNPDLDRDELIKLLADNRSINAIQKEEEDDDDDNNDKKEEENEPN